MLGIKPRYKAYLSLQWSEMLEYIITKHYILQGFFEKFIGNFRYF